MGGLLNPFLIQIQNQSLQKYMHISSHKQIELNVTYRSSFKSRERERERERERCKFKMQYNFMHGEQPLFWVTTPSYTSAYSNFEFPSPFEKLSMDSFLWSQFIP